MNGLRFRVYGVGGDKKLLDEGEYKKFARRFADVQGLPPTTPTELLTPLQKKVQGLEFRVLGLGSGFRD